jgi:predicted MFS family arabinose efflux permease
MTNASSRSAARWALGLLLAINLLNYLDRQVLYAVLPLIKLDLKATDAQLGWLASAFMIVYMLAAPPIAYWADRTARNLWISLGVAVWSVATLGSGLASGYFQLFLARAAVGVGESGYGSVSPAFVAEHYPPARRPGVLSLFYMAIPVGSALGYVLGGWIGGRYGWRPAFFFAGAPGLVLAALAWGLKDPRGAAARPSAPAGLREYLSLASNASFVRCSLAMAAMTFGLGAYAVWMPTFYTRAWNWDVARAGTLFGLLTVAAGVLGSLAGGWITDRWFKGSVRSCFVVSGAGLLAALPLGVAAVLSGSQAVGLAAMFLAEFFAFLNMGPLNAVIVGVVGPKMRSMAFAVNIFVIHALGDAVSPAVVGTLSDRYGLKFALAAASVSLGVAGLICLWGLGAIEADEQRVRAEESETVAGAA